MMVEVGSVQTKINYKKMNNFNSFNQKLFHGNNLERTIRST